MEQPGIQVPNFCCRGHGPSPLYAVELSLSVTIWLALFLVVGEQRPALPTLACPRERLDHDQNPECRLGEHDAPGHLFPRRSDLCRQHCVVAYAAGIARD